MCVCNMLETCMDYLVQLEEDQSYTSHSSVGIGAPQALASRCTIPQQLHKTSKSPHGLVSVIMVQGVRGMGRCTATPVIRRIPARCARGPV